MNYCHENTTSEPDEQWLAVKEYEGIYQVSDRGRVRSLQRWITNRNGELQLIPGKELKLTSDRYGYLKVYLTQNYQTRLFNVHHLVAQTFLPPPLGKVGSKLDSYCLNHIDGNKQNNRATNLEWITHAANQQHAIDTGLFNSSGSQTHSKLTEAEVLDIWELLREQRLSVSQIALCFDVSDKTIRKIKYGKAWRKITGYQNDFEQPVRRSWSKLTVEQVREVKVLLRERKLSIKEIAELYHVSKWTIRDIKRGNSWRDVF